MSGKDLIGSVVLSDGTKINIYMPSTGDILDNGFLTGKNVLEVMIEKSTGMSYTSFKKLPVIDGFAIMSKLGVALEAMAAYNNGLNNKKH